MNYNPEKLRNKAKELLDKSGVELPREFFNNIEKLVEDYHIHKIELELQQEELLRNNQELEFKNRRLDDLFENAPVAYFILDFQGRILEVNNTAARTLSKTKRQITGKPFNSFIHRAFQDQFYFCWQKVSQKKEPGEVEIAMETESERPEYFLINCLPFTNQGSSDQYVRLSATNVTHLKEAEALRDSERRYRLLFRNMINGLLVLKPVFKRGNLADFRFFRANAAFEKITGLSLHKLEDASILHIFPDQGEALLKLLAETIHSNTRQVLENIYLNRQTIVNFYPFVPEEDYVALIIEDVTEKVQAEKEKTKSHKLQQSIFRILPVGVTVTDSKGNIIDCNPASEELLGLKKEDHLVRNLTGSEWKIVRTDFSPMPEEEYASVRALRENRIVENVEMGIVKGPDKITWINVSAVPIPLPDMGVAIVYSDITEKVKAMEATEEKFRNIVQNSTDAIIIVNQEGAIIEWNKGCEMIFGYKRKSAFGQKIWDFVEKINLPGDQQDKDSLFGRESIEEAIRTGESQWFRKSSEMEISDACGHQKTIQSVAFPVKSSSGFLLGIVARDISETKETERMLKIAKEEAEEASHIKSQFLANMSHEIRTPLNAIMGFTGILKEYPVTDSKFKSHLSGIEKSSKALMALINDILDLSRMEAGKMKLNPIPFNIGAMVEDVKEIFSLKAEQKGLQLLAEVSPDTPYHVVLDELRIRQILFNLVGNAVKFTEKGIITIRLSAQKKETLNNSVNLTFTVEDTGPGISEKDVEAIFDPFFQKNPEGTSKQEGTGLGLAISKRFAEMMKGKIMVSSSPGRGTIFTVFIPDIPVLEYKNVRAGQKPKASKSDDIFSMAQTDLSEKMLREIIRKTGSQENARQFMREKIWNEYDKVADILGFDEVIKFSLFLLDIATQQNLHYLKAFSLKLKKEAIAFNVIEINKMLSSFENLRQS
ncbi:MAG: PAS domain S-box protein [Bacteroidota bacterium]